MADHDDAASWRSDDGIAAWLSAFGDREARRVQQRRLMAELLGFADDDPFVVVDLGAGTGAAARAVLDRYPRSSAVLVDFSPQMADAGRQALAALRGAASATWSTISPPAAHGRRASPTRLDAVISSLVLHHLPEARRQAAPRRGAGPPRPRRVVPRSRPARDERPARRRGVERHRRPPGPGVAGRAASAGTSTTAPCTSAPLERQLDRLREAGFAAVDVYWKQLDTAILGGRRPAR